MSAECDKKFILQYFHIINIGFIFQVFLTGQQAFPDDMGGGVYFSWPSADGSGSCPWQYLGMICNKKPSAIFKVGKFKAQEIDESNLSARFGQQMLQSQQPVAQVGISVEPITVLQGLQQASMESEAAMVPKFVEFTQKMVQSLFNYTTSTSLIIEYRCDFEYDLFNFDFLRTFRLRRGCKRNPDEVVWNLHPIFSSATVVFEFWAETENRSLFLDKKLKIAISFHVIFCGLIVPQKQYTQMYCIL